MRERRGEEEDLELLIANRSVCLSVCSSIVVVIVSGLVFCGK